MLIKLHEIWMIREMYFVGWFQLSNHLQIVFPSSFHHIFFFLGLDSGVLFIIFCFVAAMLRVNLFALGNLGHSYSKYDKMCCDIWLWESEKNHLRLFCLTSAVHDIKGSSKGFPKHETRHVSEHKVLIYRKYPCIIWLSLD